MIHSDVETRLRAHHILAVLLAVPSHNIATTRADDQDALQTVPEVTTMLARTSSVFSSAAALFEKLRSDKYGFSTSFRDREIQPESGYDDVSREGAELKKMSSIRNGEDTSNNPFASPNRLFGFRMSLDRTTETPMDRSPSRQPRRSTKSFKDVVSSSLRLTVTSFSYYGPFEVSVATLYNLLLTPVLVGYVQEMTVVRLSGHQAALLLSTLWLQATLPDNLPSNFEAIAHTYMLVLLFSRAKVIYTSDQEQICFYYCLYQQQGQMCCHLSVRMEASCCQLHGCLSDTQLYISYSLS